MRKPPCFDEDDYDDWVRLNETTPHGRATSPCQDCLYDYHIEMKREGRCDGVPRSIPEDSQRMLWEEENKPGDLRQQAIAMRREGASYHAIAKALGIQASTAWRWCNKG